MSVLALDRRLLMPRPRALIVRLAMGVALPVVLLMLMAEHRESAAFSVFSALFIVAQMAGAISTAHKEILAAGPTWFHRGVRRKVLAAQLTWALLEAVGLTLFLALAHPGLPAAWLGAAFGAALCVHALMALAMLYLSWGYQLPIWLFYVYGLLPSYGRAARAGRLDVALESALPWLVAAGLLLWWLGRCVVSPTLHRRLSGSFVLGAEDLFRPGRIVEYKEPPHAVRQVRTRPAVAAPSVPPVVANSAAARRCDGVAGARAWQMLALNLGVGSVRAAGAGAGLVGMLIFVLFYGYFDLAAGKSERWMIGMVYLSGLWRRCFRSRR